MINYNNNYFNRANKQQQIVSIIKNNIEKIKKHNENIREINQYNKININYELKEKYTSIIPLKLYTNWHTKNLPPIMNKNYEFLKTSNPEFEHYLFDENDCRNFIKEHFKKDVLNAYDKLLPCAYKCDLWRYCVLYINGGIYLDIKFSCTNNFKLIALTEKEYFVRDIPEKYIYNALIVVKPQNTILFNAISQIVKHTENNYYGFNELMPTGPGLLGRYISLEDINSFDLYHKYTVVDKIMAEYYLVCKDRIILKCYAEYREEQAQNQKHIRYGDLWRMRKIYN
jgi:mannosyltransferase OCH1-like enzyme